MIAIIAITKNGIAIAKKLRESLPDVTCYTLSKWQQSDFEQIPGSLKEFCGALFKEYSSLIFIMATGIVVRSIAPYVQSKFTDPAVLVIDEQAKYVISLLSGHVGGANALTIKVAETLGANPVITTASDVSGVLSADMFAKKHNLLLPNMEQAKQITAMLVNGEQVGIVDECLVLEHNPFPCSDADRGKIIISNKYIVYEHKPYVKMIPKNVIIGVGCRQETDPAQLIDFIKEACLSANIDPLSIKTIASVSIKSKEEAIWKASEHYQCALTFYDVDSLKQVEHLFKGSAFVLANVGVSSVSEPSAYLAGKKQGKFIKKKEKKNGMTVSIFQTDDIVQNIAV